ncbi:STAS domain-containing protein [Fictibacillus iocasae]|uniref:STAS domain-containing protein n=1 Tax=Fictibacillus iocasae TaxID=2715437 RepID=A0ABW2NHP6_9BACL
MLAQALDRIDNGIYMIDDNYITIFVNKKCEELLKIDRHDAIGVHIDEFLSRVPGYRRFLSLSMEKGEELRKDNIEYVWEGKRRVFNAQTKFLYEGEKRIGGLVEFMEVTTYIENEEKLEQIIDDLAANIIPVMDGIGVLPLHPASGKGHVSFNTDHTLQKSVEFGLEHLIIDLTSITAMNDTLVNELRHLISSLKLVGTDVYLSGIKPKVSAQMVSSGYELPAGNRNTFAHLKQVLHHLNENRLV